MTHNQKMSYGHLIAHEFYSKCYEETGNERYREKARESLQKSRVWLERREQTTMVTRVCSRCEKKYKGRPATTRKYCSPCRKELNAQYTKNWRKRQR